MKRLVFILAIAGVCLGVATGGLIFSELNLSIASMQQALQAPLHSMQWVINIYGIIVCSSLVIVGRLGDMFGRKRLYVIALAVLAIAILGTGMAQNINQVIFFQALNGLASAVIMPISQALVTNLFDDSKKSFALSIWSTSIGVALAAGPLYAGFMIHALSWRWVFYLNVPVIILSLVLVLFFCSESKSDESKVVVDWWGSLLLALTMASLVMALVQFEVWPLPIIILLMGLSVIFLLFLLKVEQSAQQPIIRRDLFANRAFLLSATSNALLLFFIWSFMFFVPIYLQRVVGDNVFYSGLILSIATLPLITLSSLNHVLYHRFGCKRLINIGFLSLLASSVLLFCFSKTVPMAIVVLAALTFGVAWGLIWSPSATKAISTLPRQHAGIASGTFVTFQEVGGALGLAITGLVVRFSSLFARGFKHGAIVFIVVSCLGLCISLAMKKTVK
jgi:EmrB/QacA subfamily drug resistance transporter